MMGFVNGTVTLASRESLVRTIRASVPPGTEDKNIEAFDLGASFAESGEGRET